MTEVDGPDALGADTAALLADWIDRLRAIGAYAGGGLWRQPYTPADRAAKDAVAGWMQQLGMSVREDSCGNLFGRMEGKAGGDAILTGSHLDSVRAGGHLDGALGVLAGLAALHALSRDHGLPQRPVEVAALVGEEQSRFRIPFIGSRAIAGSLRREELDVQDADGIDLATAMRGAGADPARLPAAQRRDIAAFLELHIEQGPVLERDGISTGIVTDIVGITQKAYTVLGEANHGGTTPMGMRQDAVDAAARVIAGVRDICLKAGPDAVATVGMIEVKPGAVSNIAASCGFTLDVRDRDDATRRGIVAAVDALCAAVCEERGLRWSDRLTTDIAATPMDAGLCTLLEQEARRGNIPARRMPSGAGHDAMVLAPLFPTAMVFVPSIGGKSHTPEEDTRFEDIAVGVRLLARALFRLAWSDHR